jgi:hypothetical protein
MVGNSGVSPDNFFVTLVTMVTNTMVCVCVCKNCLANMVMMDGVFAPGILPSPDPSCLPGPGCGWPRLGPKDRYACPNMCDRTKTNS